MASCFCVSIGSPGLLGQLMFATVATHAALNSCWTCGDEVTGSSFVICFVLAQE
jgi:hypothetical protein